MDKLYCWQSAVCSRASQGAHAHMQANLVLFTPSCDMCKQNIHAYTHVHDAHVPPCTWAQGRGLHRARQRMTVWQSMTSLTPWCARLKSRTAHRWAALRGRAAHKGGALKSSAPHKGAVLKSSTALVGRKLDNFSFKSRCVKEPGSSEVGRLEEW